MQRLYNSKFFQTATIIIISCLCVLLNHLTKINFTKIELPRNYPEYTAKYASGKVYNKNGKLIYKLTTNSAYEYPNDNRIFLRDFNLQIFAESSNTVKYQITGDNGWIDSHTQQGELGANITITIYNQAQTDKNIRLQGSNIKLNLAKNIFSSKNFAKATVGSNYVMTTGFNFNNASGVLNLNSKVELLYLAK